MSLCGDCKVQVYDVGGQLLDYKRAIYGLMEAV